MAACVTSNIMNFAWCKRLWPNAKCCGRQRHIIWPLRLVLPYHKGLRPAWLLRLGLFIYDHLGGRKLLPATKTLDMRSDPAGEPLQPLYAKAFEYSDCWVNDARMVVLAARDAADRGATIRTRTAVVSAHRNNDQWAITTRDVVTGETELVHARLLINAAGPWVDTVLSQTLGDNGAGNVRLVQGSHIVVKKLYEHDRCYMFQNADGRIIFAIPYETDFTLIGTTDQDYAGDPKDVRISDREVDYLTRAASEYFARPVTPHDIVWSYSGVRPLYDDGASKAQEATRDYVLKTSGGNGEAPLINVIGGKLTTFRRLAEATLTKVEGLIGAKGAAWTLTAKLPGGDFPATGFADAVTALKQRHQFLDLAYATRLVRLYGTRAGILLGAARSYGELGVHFGADLYEAEVRYLVEHEWALTSQDILWRRTKRGLLGDAIRTADLDQFLAALGAPISREQKLA